MSLDDVPRGMKFRTLASELREQIAAGLWVVGGRLPTEQELARSYRVGINTVRRAVNLLIEEDLVQRRQGSGTFVLAVPGEIGRLPVRRRTRSVDVVLLSEGDRGCRTRAERGRGAGDPVQFRVRR